MNLPVLPIRNTVIFPVLAFPINVGREASVAAVRIALESNRYMAIFAQKNPAINHPNQDDLFRIGSMVKIIKHVKMPGNKLSVVIQGISRIRMKEFSTIDSTIGEYLSAKVEIIQEDEESSFSVEQGMEKA